LLRDQVRQLLDDLLGSPDRATLLLLSQLLARLAGQVW
jgi:hypothetical protein